MSPDSRYLRPLAAPNSGNAASAAFWQGVRAAYPAQEPLLNLDNAAVSPPPCVVEDAVIEAYRLVSRNPDVNVWTRLDVALPEVKERLAAMVDCEPDEIALNRDSTEGLCTAISGIALREDDEVLLSAWDCPGVLEWMRGTSSASCARCTACT